MLFLLTVVRAGSISAGARELGWTQQAISQHLRELEHQLGTPVLMRHNRGVQPTDAGRALLVHAEVIAAQVEAARIEIEEYAQLQRGTVRLAAYWSAMASLIPQTLALVGSGIDAVLVTADPGPALDLLRAGEVDVAVIFRFAGDPAPDPALVAVPIGRETYHVVARAGHPLFGRREVRFADLADETWVVGCANCREHLVAAGRAAGFAPRIMQQTDDHLVAQAFVAEGLACSIMPLAAVKAAPNPLVVSRSFPEVEDRTFVACHRSGANRVPSVAALLTALQQAARG